jgi:hypothetical protein
MNFFGGIPLAKTLDSPLNSGATLNQTDALSRLVDPATTWATSLQVVFLSSTESTCWLIALRNYGITRVVQIMSKGRIKRLQNE